VSWEQLQPNFAAGDLTLSAPWLAELDEAVDLINGAGMDAMIDLHAFGGYSFSGTSVLGEADGETATFSGAIVSSASSRLPINTCSIRLYYTVGGVQRSTTYTSSYYCSGSNPRSFYDPGYIASSSLNYTTGEYTITFVVAPDDGTQVYATWSSSASLTDAGDGQGAFVSFWTQMATHYAANPKVHFDLMNEPYNDTAANQAPVMQVVIDAVRGEDFTGYIFVEFGSSYSTCTSVATSSGPAFITLTDAENKLVLQCHGYLNASAPPSYTTHCGNDTCGDWSYNGAALAHLSAATTYCAANGCKLFWGAFNSTYTKEMFAELKIAFDHMAANPTVWLGWTEFSGGPALGESYAGGVEPRSYTAPIPDRPNMRILNTYATGHTWPSAEGTWPNNIEWP
jgi:aryl-phospho-beta-D-glucosidase BglC (GH1 family)